MPEKNWPDFTLDELTEVARKARSMDELFACFGEAMRRIKHGGLGTRHRGSHMTDASIDTSTEKICLVDLDGTLANYEGAIRRDLSLSLSSLELQNEELLNKIRDGDLQELERTDAGIKARMEAIKAKPGWWEELAVLQDGFIVMAMANEMGFQIHILTQGPRRAGSAWSQKFAWYQKHVQSCIPEASITITRNKGMVYGRVLVDDWPEYILAWLKHRPRGVVIMPDRTYNRHFEHPQVIRYRYVDYINSPNDNEVRNALKSAFER